MLNPDLPVLVALAQMRKPLLGKDRTQTLMNSFQRESSRGVARLLLEKHPKNSPLRKQHQGALDAVRILAGTQVPKPSASSGR